MSARARTRRTLVRLLLGAADAATAVRLARDHERLADDRTAEELLVRFSRLIHHRRDRAEAAVRGAQAVAAVDGGPVCRALAGRMAGILDHLDGNASLARRKLGQAARSFESASRWTEAGDTHRVLIDVELHAERDDHARRAAHAAQRCYRRAGGVDPRRRGGLAMNLGNLHHRRDEHARALRLYAMAGRHFSAAREPVLLAHAEYNRANVLSTLDRTDQARRLYEGARAVYARNDLPALVARADFALGVLDLLEGRLDACVQRLAAVRERLRGLGDRAGVAHADLDSAEAYLRLNRPVDAEEAARRADLYFRASGGRAETASCAGLLGGAALQQGRAGLAARRFAKGCKIQRGLGNPIAAAMLQIGQAQAEHRAGRSQRGLALARQASLVLGRRRLGSRKARALAVGADAALGADRPAAAREMSVRARNLARKHRDARVELAALLVQSRIEEGRGRSAEAYRLLRAAERCVERLRPGVTTEESRLAFAVDKSEVYAALVLNRLRRGDARAVRQALIFAERGKARALAQRLAEGSLQVLGQGSPATGALLRRLSSVERKIAVAESRLQESQAPGLRAGRDAELGHLTEARQRTLRRLEEQDPQSAQLVGASPPDPQEIIEQLGPDELALVYTEAGGQLHLFAIERGRIEAHASLVAVASVRERIEMLRFQLGKGVLGEQHASRYASFLRAAQRGYLEWLHDALLRPVARRIAEGRRLRIIPHGILHGLPFHALEHGGVAVVDRCVVSYAPSLTALGLISRRPSIAGSRPLVLGVADAAAPLIETEVEVVRRHVSGARVFRGDEATHQALVSDSGRPSLLHVACHGFYSDEGPWSSGLRLGDAWLSLPDLFGLHNMADLVVLSGCETGRGTVYSGDEWVGIVRGFLQAGSRAVVASLWEVQDSGTVALMDGFYRGLTAGLPVADALAGVQRAARRDDPLVLRWAPFVVVGEPDLRLRRRKAA